MKLKINKNKHAIAALIVLTFAVTAIALPAANGHYPPWNIPTYAFLNVTPNPVGVGQAVQVTFWLDKVPPTANTIWGDRWELSVKVTKPDGTIQSFGPYKTDDVGGTYMIYTPDAIGTYYFQMSFPGQTIVGANPPPFGTTTGAASINDTFLPSTSQKVPLTVQQEPIKGWPATPLPTDYWTRPISLLNPEWQSIAGDWLMSGYDAYGNRYNPFTTAPESSHVVWTYPVAFGGVAGGNFSDVNYYTGLTYESKFNSPLIMYGRLFFNKPLSTSAGSGGAVCIDLRTGKELWWQNNTRISLGQSLTTLRLTNSEKFHIYGKLVPHITALILTLVSGYSPWKTRLQAQRPSDLTENS